MTEPLLSVIVPNYKTPELTKICLRLLRLYSDPAEEQAIVIDNDSREDSLEYLHSFDRITLPERPAVPGKEGFVMHRKLVDAGFEMIFPGSDHLGRCISHLNHAAMILNPRSSDRKTSKAAAKKKLGKALALFRRMLERNDLDC